MSESRILGEIWRILDADLPSATLAVALRLIRRANLEVGQANLTWDEFLAVCQCSDRDNARRHLIKLGRHNLVHYSTNDNVYVTFLAWLMDDMGYDPSTAKNAFQNAENARENANSAVERNQKSATAKNAFQNAENARENAENARENANSAEINKYSSSSSNSEVYQFRSELIARSRQMLRECGIFPADAERISKQVSFEVLREHIFTWRKDARANGPGALKHRIDHDFSCEPLDDDDRQTAFYIRFRTPEEEYASEAQPDVASTSSATHIEPTPPTPLATPPDSPESTAWQTVLSDLALQMPSASFNNWVRDTWVSSVTDDKWVIGTPNQYAFDWLNTRLSKKISRTLSSLVRSQVSVEFVVQPRAVPNA